MAAAPARAAAPVLAQLRRNETLYLAGTPDQSVVGTQASLHGAAHGRRATACDQPYRRACCAACRGALEAVTLCTASQAKNRPGGTHESQACATALGQPLGVWKGSLSKG